MADSAPETAVEAAAPETAPTDVSVGKEKSLRTSVFAVAGGVPKSSVLQAAIQSVRDAIPVVYDLNAEIVGAKKSKQNGQDGTSFDVEITYTARELAGGKKDPVDVDRVIKSLEVPLSVHEGDPEFLEPR